ncbi:MAG: protein kinase [Chlamydiota bacterium]
MSVSPISSQFTLGVESIKDLFPILETDEIQEIWKAVCDNVLQPQVNSQKISLLSHLWECKINKALVSEKKYMIRLKLYSTVEKINRICGAYKELHYAILLDQDTNTVSPYACLVMNEEIAKKEIAVYTLLNSFVDAIQDLTKMPAILFPEFVEAFVSKKDHVSMTRVFFPFFNRGELDGFKRLHEELFIKAEHVAYFGSTLLQTIAFLHEHHWVHGDLKLNNILVKKTGFALSLYLIDFGTATPVDPMGRFESDYIMMTYRLLPPEIFLPAGEMLCLAAEKRCNVEEIITEKMKLYDMEKKKNPVDENRIKELESEILQMQTNLQKAIGAQSIQMDHWGLGIIFSAILAPYFRAHILKKKEDIVFWGDIAGVKGVYYKTRPIRSFLTLFSEPHHFLEPKDPILHFLWFYFFQKDPKNRPPLTEAVVEEWKQLFLPPAEKKGIIKNPLGSMHIQPSPRSTCAL